MGLSVPLTPDYVMVAPSYVTRIPQVTGLGCSDLGILTTDRQLGITNNIPADFNPRPKTNPTPVSYTHLDVYKRQILLQLDTSREEKLELEWDNQDRARIEDEAAGKSRELARVGKSSDNNNPLTGEWSTQREWKGAKYPARISFFPDERVLCVVTLRTEHGRYSTQSSNIRLEIAGRPLVEGTFAMTGNRLTLPNPKGGASGFDRF